LNFTLKNKIFPFFEPKTTKICQETKKKISASSCQAFSRADYVFVFKILNFRRKINNFQNSEKIHEIFGCFLGGFFWSFKNIYI
jgi:hypothetical protein